MKLPEPPSATYVFQKPPEDPWDKLAPPKHWGQVSILPALAQLEIPVQVPFVEAVRLPDIVNPAWLRVFSSDDADHARLDFNVVYAEGTKFWGSKYSITHFVLREQYHSKHHVTQCVRLCTISTIRKYLAETVQGPEPKCAKCDRDAFWREHELIGEDFLCIRHGIQRRDEWTKEATKYMTFSTTFEPLIDNGPPLVALWNSILNQIAGKVQQREKDRQMSLGDRWDFGE